jgi:hypothetical protein
MFEELNNTVCTPVPELLCTAHMSEMRAAQVSSTTQET